MPSQIHFHRSGEVNSSLAGCAVYKFARFTLQSGDVLADAHLVVRTYGTLNAARDNAILFPTWFSSQHHQNEWLIGPAHALDPSRWFIIVPNMLANGLSSSPSNTLPPHDRERFPPISLMDNVLLQRRLLIENFGIDHLALAIGRSMGAQQAFQWGCLFPNSVLNILAITGSARTSRHNAVFLAGVEAALKADSTWANGEYKFPPLTGLRAVGRIYAGWALSQAWYRNRPDTQSSDGSMESYLANNWDGNFVTKDANDLLSQLRTWQVADVSKNSTFCGDFDAALGAITARAIVMPSRTDLYFSWEDSAYEVSRMRDAELRVIESDWGHRAASPRSDPSDVNFVEKAIRDLLEH